MRRRAFPAGLVALGVVLAGCLGQAPADDGTSGGQGGDPSVALDLDQRFRLDDCRSLLAVFLVDRDDAQALLPPGFVAQDGGNLAGAGDLLPDASGRASLMFTAVACERHSGTGQPFAWSMVNIDTEAPDAPGYERPPDSEHDSYELWFGSTDPDVARLRQAQGARGTANVSVDHAGLGTARTATASARDADGLVWAMTAEVVGPVNDLGWTHNHWYRTARGTGLWETDQATDPTYSFGSLTSCEVRAGTDMARLLSAAGCLEQQYLVPVHSDFSLSGRFRFVPAPVDPA